jgi:hypothetical protein
VLLLAWKRRSDPSDCCEQRETPSRLARLVCCSPAPRGALLASRWRFPGEALSRESLTQDSRSAVKARSFDPSVDHSAKGVAPVAKLAWRPRERPARGFERFVTRRNALESRADRGMRAYVTGGDHRQWTTRAMRRCVRATASRHVGWRAQGSQHTSGANASCSTYRMVVALCGSGSGGWRATPAFLCRRHRLRWQLRTAGDAMVPVVLTGMRGRNIESAHRHRAAPTALRLHLTYRSCVERRTATSLKTR